jgi:uncharacterized Ntn-hydrolase superfamily protein
MTYSLVARDPQTGQLGVAVQSHWFSVGSVVPWAAPGVGVVATQSVAEPAYGPRLLDRLRAGEDAAAALAAEVAADEVRELRQVLVLAPEGPPALHTGGTCIPVAGQAATDDVGAAANMMAADGVPEALLQGFAAGSDVPLAWRLLGALEAAEGAGGDVRGRQSAALLVVGPSGEPWERVRDLRVEDHEDPVGELRRLLGLADAYEQATLGDDLAGAGDAAGAAAAYVRAGQLAPEAVELRFWAGLSRAQGGDVAGGAAEVAAVVERRPGFGVLLERLTEDLAPAAPAVRAHLAATHPKDDG